MRLRFLAPVIALLALLAGASVAFAHSHEGRPDVQRWPKSFILLQNDGDQRRALDGRPGFSPFADDAPSSACNAECQRALVPCEGDDCQAGGRMWPQDHSFDLRLLGGRANDTIHGGPGDDVIWGQLQPTNNPTTQVDRLYGGAGDDFIYESRGFNRIEGGAGNDRIRMRLGRGIVDCGPGNDIVFVALRTLRNSTFRNCETKARRSPD